MVELLPKKVILLVMFIVVFAITGCNKVGDNVLKEND